MARADLEWPLWMGLRTGLGFYYAGAMIKLGASVI